LDVLACTKFIGFALEPVQGVQEVQRVQEVMFTGFRGGRVLGLFGVSDIL